MEKPTRNNRGVANEYGTIENAYAHIKVALKYPLLLHGNGDFADLAGYRRLIDEVVNARNPLHSTGIDAERKFLQPLPDVGTTAYEEVRVTVISSGGLTLRMVFYTVPSRLSRHRLQPGLYYDRLDVSMGARGS